MLSAIEGIESVCLATHEESAGAIKRLALPNELVGAAREEVARHILEGEEGACLFVDCRHPLTEESLREAVNAYRACAPSILVGTGPDGLVSDALLIAEGTAYRERGERALCYLDPYVQMLTQEEASLEKAPLPFADGYSTEEQLALSQEFPDRIGEALNLEPGADEKLLEAARDNPERAACLASIPTGEDCLDIGCSDGAITILLAKERKRRVLGIDIRPDAIQAAEQRLAEEDEEVRSRVRFEAVAAEEDGVAERFDAIYITEVMEHIPLDQDRELLKKYAKKLKQGGKMILSVPNRMAAERYVRERRTRWYWGGHVTHFSKSSFERLLKGYFEKVRFHTLHDDASPQEGVFLICECSELKE